MRLRIRAAKFLIKLGRLIQSTAVVVMRPDDLVEFSRQYYMKADNIKDWCAERRIHYGLTDLEQSLLDHTGLRGGKVLMLGLGGGREAIHLAKMGFKVTGVDFVPKMLESAIANARQNGVQISGVVQEISQLTMPENTYDLAWLSAAMYSCVPTRSRRVRMLERIQRTLKPGGYFVFEFFWNPKADGSNKTTLLKKTIAWLSLGHLHYQRGDTLRFNREFLHVFTTPDELKAEITQAGFELIDIQLVERNEFAGAIIRRPIAMMENEVENQNR